ncbi:hypothetical protein [Dawidia soli]|uniref:Uncharacterized protein n=1 Tax=Dawidia soli TaxID=2782352 RepID=A0AAP2DB64_9BACT|nr:hypothetical protein [Dawidia soli]MBT1687670.1 hypothetical protein [Dawidia soli]
MRYRSPFSLLYLNGYRPDPGSWDEAWILRIQKDLLLELEHHGGGMLQIEKEGWTKDDILKLTDALRPSEERMYHQWISADPALLRLLERGQVSDKGPLYNPALADHPAFESFQSFVSPYLAESIGRALSQAFAQYNFSGVRRLLEATALLTTAHVEEVQARLAGLLEDLAHALRRVEMGEEAFDRERFGRFVTPDFITLLNGLPESQAALREWLSVGLVNVLAKKVAGFAFSRKAYKCLLEMQCPPHVRQVLLSNYRSFRWLPVKLLAMWMSLCLIVYSLIMLGDIDSYPSSAVGTDTYRSYRNHLRTLVQKQMTPSGADSMRYILLTNPQVNNDHTLWHHAVPGTHLSDYRAAGAQPLTMVNRSPYDAVLFVMSDSALYNGFLARGDSLQVPIQAGDRLAFYVGNSWVPPGSMKRGVYPWTDVKALYGIFTSVDSTTLLLLDKIYCLSAAGAHTMPACIRLTTGDSGLLLDPGQVLEEISEKSP